MKRSFVIAVVVVAIIAAGAYAYTQFQPGPVQAQRGDPAIAIATTIRVLERSEQYRLTQEQVKEILPLLKVLRDTDPNDAEASRALAEQVRATFTPAQRAEIERVRDEARRQRQSTDPERSGPGRPGAGRGFGPPGGSQGGSDRGFSRAEFRQRMLSRLIERLESRL